MNIFDSIIKMNKLHSGERVKFSYAEVCNNIINLPDASKNLPKDQFNQVFLLFQKYKKDNIASHEVDLFGYYQMCLEIIDQFDKIAPYEKYSGASEEETALLMNEVREAKKRKNDDIEGASGISDNTETETVKQNNSSIHLLNPQRAAEVKKLLIERGVDLPESDYQLYGNMFEIIAQLTNNKIDNQTMVDVFDELSDLVLNKKPSFSALILKGQEYKVQIRYLNEMNLLQELTEEEREAFVFCVWHASRTYTTDVNGDIVTCLCDFDSYDHIKQLYEEDRIIKKDYYPSNETKEETTTPTQSDFGFSPDNPIQTTSIKEAYNLIKSIKYHDESVRVSTRYSTRDSNRNIIDGYELTTGSGENVRVFINSYSYENSKALPEGFSLISNEKDNAVKKDVVKYSKMATDIGLDNYMKDAFSNHSTSPTSCAHVLEFYKEQNDRISFKNYLMDWIQNTPYERKWHGGALIYKDHYELFRWLDDLKFDVEYLDYIIQNGDRNSSEEAGDQKRQHLRISLFTDSITRKD